jgi:hypothetical protein
MCASWWCSGFTVYVTVDSFVKEYQVPIKVKREIFISDGYVKLTRMHK